MNIERKQVPVPEDGITLSYDRTIDRSMVHRDAVSEVFLTDAVVLDEQRVALAAQLPTCHGYFHDHVIDAAVDPFMVIEAARQATLASAHLLGVPADVILVSETMDFEIVDVDAWGAHQTFSRLRIDSEFSWTKMRRGLPRAGICTQRISIDDRLLATHSSSGRLLARREMATLRAAQRDSAPPWTADMVDGETANAVPAADVKRTNPLNVVLAELQQQGSELRAVVAPRWSNRALFDHSYDHLTMQVLSEAARQLAGLAADRATVSGAAGDADRNTGWQLVAMSGSFQRFAEIDSVVTVRTTIPPEAGTPVALTISIDQESLVEAADTEPGPGDRAPETVAVIELTLAPDRSSS